MKNIIITHNEIQLNLFLAVTYGMEAMFDGKYAVIGESREREYEWRVVETHKIESSAYEKAIFYYHINKGDYQMNDLRVGVTTAYIRDEAEKFITEFRKFIADAGIKKDEKPKVNLLHEFWNRTSDACPLEASAQEQQEKEWSEWYESRRSTQPHPESDRWQLAHGITDQPPLSNHSVYLTNDQGDVPLAGYGSDYHNALNHLEIQINADDCPFVIVKK